MNHLKFILFILIFQGNLSVAFAQAIYPPRVWKLVNHSGEARVSGIYREQETLTLTEDKAEMQELYGGLMLKTSSYVISPNVFFIDADGEYTPGTRKESHLVFPDQAEERNLYRANIRTHFFREQPINFGATANISDGFSNRENLTDMKSVTRGYGGFLNIRNKWFPLQFTLNKQEFSNREMESGRLYAIDQLSFHARGSRDFSKNNKLGLKYHHNDYLTTYFSTLQVKSVSDLLTCNHDFIFKSSEENKLRSILLFQNQEGSMQFQRWNLGEHLSYALPKKFHAEGNYQFNNTRQGKNTSNQHSLRSSLRYKVYLSLTSTAYYEFSTMNHTLFNEYFHKPGLNLLYEKKIPRNCRLVFSYNYFKQFHYNTSDPILIPVVGEQLTLTDGRMVLLSRPEIEISSVVVTDATGVIIYQNNLDYVLIAHGDYLEIQRVPGGQITDNTSVSVHYRYLQDKSYHYNINSHGFNSSFFMLKNILEAFFNFQKNDYSDVINMEQEKLNYFNRTAYGLRANYRFIKSGIEFTEYQSRLIPYRSERYYLQLDKQLLTKLNVSLNGNYMIYHYPEIDDDQEFADISGAVGYRVTSKTDVSIESSYRKQKGEQINLDLFIARMKFSTSYGNMYFSCGADIYRRLYIGEKLNFNSVYVKLSRKF